MRVKDIYIGQTLAPLAATSPLNPGELSKLVKLYEEYLKRVDELRSNESSAKEARLTEKQIRINGTSLSDYYLSWAKHDLAEVEKELTTFAGVHGLLTTGGKIDESAIQKITGITLKKIRARQEEEQQGIDWAISTFDPMILLMIAGGLLLSNLIPAAQAQSTSHIAASAGALLAKISIVFWSAAVAHAETLTVGGVAVILSFIATVVARRIHARLSGPSDPLEDFRRDMPPPLWAGFVIISIFVIAVGHYSQPLDWAWVLGGAAITGAIIAAIDRIVTRDETSSRSARGTRGMGVIESFMAFVGLASLLTPAVAVFGLKASFHNVILVESAAMFGLLGGVGLWAQRSILWRRVQQEIGSRIYLPTLEAKRIMSKATRLPFVGGLIGAMILGLEIGTLVSESEFGVQGLMTGIASLVLGSWLYFYWGLKRMREQVGAYLPMLAGMPPVLQELEQLPMGPVRCGPATEIRSFNTIEETINAVHLYLMKPWVGALRVDVYDWRGIIYIIQSKLARPEFVGKYGLRGGAYKSEGEELSRIKRALEEYGGDSYVLKFDGSESLDGGLHEAHLFLGIKDDGARAGASLRPSPSRPLQTYAPGPRYIGRAG